MGRQRHQTAPEAHLQAVERCVFRGEILDVISLYLNPPQKALVLCCDEKSQCQALERTQPGLPLGIGHTATHDDIRHGTLTLFAALNYLEGKLIATIAEQHRHQEWLAFLRKIDRETPKDLAIRLSADNDATHKHPEVKASAGQASALAHALHADIVLLA